MAGFQVCGLGSQGSGGYILTLPNQIPPKLTVSGILVAVLGAKVFKSPTTKIVTKLTSTKLTIGGIPVVKVGSKTSDNAVTMIQGIPKLTVSS